MTDKFTLDFINEAFERIDKVLVKHEPTRSRVYWQKMVQEGHVFVDGIVINKVNTKIKAGTRVQVLPLDEQQLDLVPEAIPLDIVYEDADVAIINKPIGMVVHPGFGHEHGTLVHALLYHMKDLSSINGIIRPGIVHRIDKDTSGLIMVAKNDTAHIALSEQLRDKSLYREYIALVHGRIPEARFTVDMPIGRHPKERTKMSVEPEGKEAVTHIEVIERFNDYTLVRARLETGRTHQIRVHLQAVGFPIVGDPLYTTQSNQFHLTGQFLHAYKLGFIHPRTEEPMSFTTDLPSTFQTIIDTLKNK